MATYTDTLGFVKGTAAFPAYAAHLYSQIEVVLDFAKITAARAAAGAVALTATDILQVLPVPAGTLVLAVGADVTKAEGAAATIDVGDGTSATRYLSNTSINAVANTVSALTAPQFYAAADTIDITIDTASTDAAIVRVWALIVDCNG